MINLSWQFILVRSTIVAIGMAARPNAWVAAVDQRCGAAFEKIVSPVAAGEVESVSSPAATGETTSTAN